MLLFGFVWIKVLREQFSQVFGVIIILSADVFQKEDSQSWKFIPAALQQPGMEYVTAAISATLLFLIYTEQVAGRNLQFRLLNR